MSFSARLVNATPLHVSWKWHRGIVLEIGPFGYLDISAQMMEQFMPDQPGYDGIKQEMDHFGVFLQDSSRTYESQAEEALKASIKTKKTLYDECEKSARKRFADGGALKEETIKLEMDQAGYSRLLREVEKLQGTLKTIQAANAKTKRTLHEQYDPERTLLFTNPPRVFPSALSMKLFLSQEENSELRAQYKKFMENFNSTAKAEKTEGA